MGKFRAFFKKSKKDYHTERSSKNIILNDIQNKTSRSPAHCAMEEHKEPKLKSIIKTHKGSSNGEVRFMTCRNEVHEVENVKHLIEQHKALTYDEKREAVRDLNKYKKKEMKVHPSSTCNTLTHLNFSPLFAEMARKKQVEKYNARESADAESNTDHA